LLPDINRSQKNFTPFGDKIFLGLSAIRLRDRAIANIIQAREEAGGRFTSLIDFCDRVDLKLVVAMK
jgi:DNA polymerase III subunit alpha